MFGPFFTVFIIFLILKLVGVIDWSWVWVTAPLWVGLALTIVFMLGILLVLGAAAITIKKLLWH
jgi:hypothetical protein